jgi:hypothetical protein
MCLTGAKKTAGSCAPNRQTPKTVAKVWSIFVFPEERGKKNAHFPASGTINEKPNENNVLCLGGGLPTLLS